MFTQVLAPFADSLLLSALLAALPLVTLFALLGIFKVKAAYAAVASLAVAFLLAVAVWRMPVGQAFSATAEGAFYGLFTAVFSTVVSLVFGPAIAQMASRMVERMPQVPPFVTEMMERAQQEAGTFSILGFLLELLLWGFCGAVFSTLGGLLGGALFKHEPPPPVPPAMPPPVPPADWGGMPPAGP